MQGESTFETSVGRIVAENPSAARVFEKHRIDYCCGGKTSLREACERENIAPAALLDEIADASSADAVSEANATIHWNGQNLSELAEHIVVTYHNYLRTELPRLDRLLRKVLNAHPQHSGTIWIPLQGVLREFTVELLAHMNKEETVLFPWIAELESVAAAEAASSPRLDKIQRPIESLENEHRSASKSLAAMRRLTSEYDPPSDACNTVRALYHGLKILEADLHTHIHLENNILFPRARTLERKMLATEIDCVQ